VMWARIFTAYYFLFFPLMWIIGIIETPSEMPRSITESVLGKGGGKAGAIAAHAAPEKR